MTEYKHTQVGPLVQVSAGIAAVVPMAALTSWMYVVRDGTPGLAEFFLGPLLAGGTLIFWLLFLHLVMCRDSLQALGFRISGFWRDAATGVVLGLAFLLLKYLTDPFLRGLFEPRPPSEEIMELIFSVASDPLLLVLWLGPVVWIGIAGFEELWRVVVLRRFWAVCPGTQGKWGVLLAVSVLIGVAHGYQGPAAIISITIKSVLMGWFFMVTGRTRPLVVAHALYDSLQIVMAVISIQRMA